MYDSSYQIGRATGQVVVLALIVWGIVWAVRAARRPVAAGAPVRTPEGDMASLTTVVVLQMVHDNAAALVSRVLAAYPHLTPVPGPVPTWGFGGRHPYLTLTPSPAGSVFRVQEVELPLMSPAPVLAWEWAIDAVETEARRLAVPTTRGQQRLAPSRPNGPATVIWAAVG